VVLPVWIRRAVHILFSACCAFLQNKMESIPHGCNVCFLDRTCYVQTQVE
jgi:hypothetical protein